MVVEVQVFETWLHFNKLFMEKKIPLNKQERKLHCTVYVVINQTFLEALESHVLGAQVGSAVQSCSHLIKVLRSSPPLCQIFISPFTGVPRQGFFMT